MRYLLAFLGFSLLPSPVWGQQQPHPESSAPQDMPNMSMGEATKDGDAATSAMHSMEGTINMGPHMRMTERRPEQPGDAERPQPLSSEIDFWKI